MAALSTVAAIAAIGASAFSVGKTLTQKGPKAPPAPPELPAAPDATAETRAADEAATKAGIAERQKSAAPGRRGFAGTILTGPSGVQAPAPVAYKTLLGQ